MLPLSAYEGAEQQGEQQAEGGVDDVDVERADLSVYVFYYMQWLLLYVGVSDCVLNTGLI